MNLPLCSTMMLAEYYVCNDVLELYLCTDLVIAKFLKGISN